MNTTNQNPHIETAPEPAPGKYTLALVQRMPFACSPRFVELAPEEIACNNIILPFGGEYNPHGTRLWVIGNEYGALGAVWADCEQDALDELIDQNLGEALLIDDENQAEQLEEWQAEHGPDSEPEDWSRLGNAGEPCDLTHVWMAPVEFKAARDLCLLLKLAEARGAGASLLSEV